MSKPSIIILYKDKSYKMINESKLYKHRDEFDNIKYLLFQSLTNPLVYYPILPDKRLLSGYFKMYLKFTICEADFDEDMIKYIDSFDFNYETNSVSDFIEHLSIYYKLYGSSEILESAFLGDGYSIIREIYPSYYHIQFGYDKENDIDSGELEDVKSGVKRLYCPAFNWITEDRMGNLSCILLTIDSDKNSSLKLPRLMEMSDECWTKITKYNEINKYSIDNDSILLVKINEFNSYYLMEYSVYQKMCKISTLNFDVSIINVEEDLKDELYYHYATHIYLIGQIERNALYKYIKEEHDYSYYFSYNFSIGDIYLILSWLVYGKDIISYLLALYKTESDDNLLLLRSCNRLFETVLTDREILSGKLNTYMYKYLKEEY